jgi:hypothetical protein
MPSVRTVSSKMLNHAFLAPTCVPQQVMWNAQRHHANGAANTSFKGSRRHMWDGEYIAGRRDLTFQQDLHRATQRVKPEGPIVRYDRAQLLQLGQVR